MKKIIWALVVLTLLIGGYFAYDYYNKIYLKGIDLKGKEKMFIFIPSGSDTGDVIDLLDSIGILRDKSDLLWLAEKKNYQGKNVVAGKYELRRGMSHNELINHLRAGNGRLEVNVTFNNVRTLEQLAGRVAPSIEADSAELMAVFTHPDTIARYGFNRENFRTLFIPNTYRMDWATSAGEFLKICANNYKEFWTNERKNKAKDLGLAQSEVTILASIVQAEQSRHADERPKIAGLYLNRLKKGMLLQSDPTVVFALGDFGKKRVYLSDLEIDSPYNTYKYKGLPPGPIIIPDISSIDAVLNAEKHDYIFMCAKPEYGGYHNFAKTNAQHEEHAATYRRWLQSEGIR